MNQKKLVEAFKGFFQKSVAPYVSNNQSVMNQWRYLKSIIVADQIDYSELQFYSITNNRPNLSKTTSDYASKNWKKASQIINTQKKHIEVSSPNKYKYAYRQKPYGLFVIVSEFISKEPITTLGPQQKIDINGKYKRFSQKIILIMNHFISFLQIFSKRKTKIINPTKLHNSQQNQQLIILFENIHYIMGCQSSKKEVKSKVEEKSEVKEEKKTNNNRESYPTQKYDSFILVPPSQVNLNETIANNPEQYLKTRNFDNVFKKIQNQLPHLKPIQQKDNREEDQKIVQATKLGNKQQSQNFTER